MAQVETREAHLRLARLALDGARDPRHRGGPASHGEAASGTVAFVLAIVFLAALIWLLLAPV